ncbi:hypothetical protein [Streptomyces sp. NPDC055992]|uniref:hypothetical protein n=1 Tax=Streptomyces sp. NPDC055992 TaxID=3345673 RepID=UPI0035D68589
MAVAHQAGPRAGPFLTAAPVPPVVCVQNPYADDLALLAECEAAGIAYVPFFLLGGGREPLDTRRLEKVAGRLGSTEPASGGAGGRFGGGAGSRVS